MSILSNYREASGIIYTSGATSAPGDAPTQIRGCFEKLKAILASVNVPENMSVIVRTAGIGKTKREI